MRDSGSRTRSDPQKDLVGFLLGGVHYAVKIARVRKIIPPSEITVLPHTPMEVAGVADYRGEVVPVIDLRVRFGLTPQAGGRTTKWILISVGGDHSVGIIVDAVTEVFGTPEGLRPTPEIGGDRERRGISGVVNHNGKLTFVLDTSRFVEIFEALAASGAV
jgi:purine-binding chemotaxis protein CheW